MSQCLLGSMQRFSELEDGVVPTGEQFTLPCRNTQDEADNLSSCPWCEIVLATGDICGFSKTDHPCTWDNPIGGACRGPGGRISIARRAVEEHQETSESFSSYECVHGIKIQD